MVKKSNHYVPQFYLRNFSTDRKTVGVYALKRAKYIKTASIRNQACRDFLYGDDGNLEDMFMYIETDASKIIRYIVNSNRIPGFNSTDYQTLLFFLLISEARNAKTADSVNHMIDVQMKTILQMQRPDVVDLDFVNEYKINLGVPNAYSLKAAAGLFPILMDLKCVLIVNDTSDRLFITSDNPLVRYNKMYVERNYQLRGYGLGNVGIMLFLPITPHLCICLFDDDLYDYDSDASGNIHLVKGKHVDELNKLFYLNSYEVLFFSGNVSESYISRIVLSMKHSNAEIDKELVIFGTNSEKLIAFSPRKVEQHINLPMFTIKEALATTPLPDHMGGPMRPWASQFVQYMERD